MAHFNPALSGKMTVLVAMLEQTKSQTNDRFVLVSNFTKTLDLMHLVCQDHGWKTVRLDGSTKNTDRQPIVERFNDGTSGAFIFLLSSKAGGCGLNLIGANRLVLFDPAWNPATDRQAMARVWRDGQTKSVFIYRMLSTATLEERVYQRQILKEEVATAVVDRDDSGSKGGGKGGKGGVKGGGSNSSSDDSRNFSPDELKKLFAETGLIVTVEAHVSWGGVYAAVSEHVPVKRALSISLPPTCGESTEKIMEFSCIDRSAIKHAVLEICK